MFLRHDSGTIDIGETIRFGYYSQQGMTFRDDQKVIDAVRDIAEYIDMGNGEKLSAGQFLQHFLFSPEEQYSYIYKLSGGERRRLYLCTVLMKAPNFLILDEPTNDIDVNTLRALEEGLEAFAGCAVVISHDRWFLDRICTHILAFEGDGNIFYFEGSYTDYEANKAKRLGLEEPKRIRYRKLMDE